MKQRRHFWFWCGVIGLLGLVLVRAGLIGAEPVATAAAEIPLTLDLRSGHDLVVTQPEPDFVELRTTDVDPFIATVPFNPAVAGRTVLTFEYVAVAAIPGFEVFVGTPWSEARMQGAAELPHSEGWSTFSIDLSLMWARNPTPPNRLRLDFGREPGQVIQVRNLRLRLPNDRERDVGGRESARSATEVARDGELRAYLARVFPTRLTRVTVGTEEIEIAGEVGNTSGELVLAEAELWQDVVHAREVKTAAKIPRSAGANGAFSLRVSRYVTETGGKRDRLLSRWLILRGAEPLSAARYADAAPARFDWPEKKARSKKGLGGFVAQRPEAVADLDALGIDSVTVNLFLSRFLHAAASAKAIPFTHLGRTYYADRAEVEKLDQTLLAAAKRDALVLGILLVAKAGAWEGPLGAIMQHPDCDPTATYSMANLTRAPAVEHYAALLDFLAERYSRPRAPYGRIHHWIVHNEVDAGWVWTNCGEIPPVLYMDQYHKSMRLTQLIARQYDPHARAYISLTHFWTTTASHRFTPGREVLEHLLEFSKVEGDFDWGIAHHPYPESLRDPKTWLDRQARFDFDTPLITFKNIEVLDAWVRQPSQRFLGRSVRSVHLSEQGPNSPDYSPRSLEEQAAAMAYLWQKIRRLEAIEGFQFHNWADNRREGGLRIGLRRYPDDADAPLGPKPVWHVYRALDTASEAEATAFALPLIGLKDWNEAPYRGSIPTHR